MRPVLVAGDGLRTSSTGYGARAGLEACCCVGRERSSSGYGRGAAELEAPGGRGKDGSGGRPERPGKGATDGLEADAEAADDDGGAGYL